MFFNGQVDRVLTRRKDHAHFRHFTVCLLIEEVWLLVVVVNVLSNQGRGGGDEGSHDSEAENGGFRV